MMNSCRKLKYQVSIIRMGNLVYIFELSHATCMRKIVVITHAHTFGGRQHIDHTDLHTAVFVVEDHQVANAIVDWYVNTVSDDDKDITYYISQNEYAEALKLVTNCTYLDDGWFYTVHDLD